MARRLPQGAAFVLATGLALAAGAAPASASAGTGPVVGHTITTLASTIPANGDLNPYGVAVVPSSIGDLHRGDVLVSNFNNSQNQQGTGTTIVEVTPKGEVSTFATIDPAKLPGECPGGVGLTTALVVLRSGWVIVGSLPTSDGTSATAKAGCLIVLDSKGEVRETIAGQGINGPWDMTAADDGGFVRLFVTNVLDGTVAASPATVNRGTVLRISLVIRHGRPPQRVDTTTVGSGFPQRTDPTALVIGPTGVGLSDDGTLYVADTLGNRIAAIPDALKRHTSAGTGRTVTSGGALNGPLGLAIGPKHTILTVNGGDGYLVVTDPCGCRQIQKVLLDNLGTPPGAGALFGLALKPHTNKVYFVDDNENALNLLS